MPLPFLFKGIATAYGIPSPVVRQVTENTKESEKLCCYCGAKVALEDKFCSKCGKELGYIKEHEAQSKDE